MDPTFQKAKEIFVSLVDSIPAHEWEAHADAACGGDDILRQRVRALLHAHANQDSRLEQPGIESTQASPGLTPESELPDTQIGPYKLLEQIGEGGMGIVYVASQKECASIVAAGCAQHEAVAAHG